MLGATCRMSNSSRSLINVWICHAPRITSLSSNNILVFICQQRFRRSYSNLGLTTYLIGLRFEMWSILFTNVFVYLYDLLLLRVFGGVAASVLARIPIFVRYLLLDRYLQLAYNLRSYLFVLCQIVLNKSSSCTVGPKQSMGVWRNMVTTLQVVYDFNEGNWFDLARVPHKCCPNALGPVEPLV